MVLGATIVTAVAASLVLLRVRGNGRLEPLAGTGRRRPRSHVTGLVVVTGLIYLNQVLFTVYVLREHGGDPSFIARYLPEGWFTLAHGPVFDSLARRVPAPELLAPSVLRVNAFLELPFVVLGYLTVCRWSSSWTYERALGQVWPMSLSYTVTFCLIEWHLYNPYTVQDIAVRVVAALVVPWWVTSRPPPGPPGRTDNLPGLLVFVASAVAFGALGLVVYDTALLYNLGHLDAQLPFAALAIVVLAVARAIAPRVPDQSPGRGVHSIAQTTSWLLVLAAVPALPIRYGLGFGAPYTSVVGAVVLLAVAAVLGARDALARSPVRPAQWLLQMAAVAIAGLCTAAPAMLVDVGHTETRLLLAGAAGFLGALLVCARLDRPGAQRDTNPPALAGPSTRQSKGPSMSDTT